MGLDPTKKTILYAPSRRGVGSWDHVAESIIKTTPLSYNLILRPHPNQALTSRQADRASFRRIQTIAKNRPNSFLDLTSQALSTLLSIIDLIVSDANSPAEESLFYDVPQLFIETNCHSRKKLEDQAKNEGMHPEDTDQLTSLYNCGPTYFVKDSITFDSIIDNAISDAPNYALQRENFFTWVFGTRDRQANQRVAQAITSRLLQ